MTDHLNSNGSQTAEIVTPAVESALRHFPRRALTGEIEIVDRAFDFVRATLPYDYRFTCNAQQWDEAERICRALEGPMVSLGIGKASGLRGDR